MSYGMADGLNIIMITTKTCKVCGHDEDSHRIYYTGDKKYPLSKYRMCSYGYFNRQEEIECSCGNRVNYYYLQIKGVLI